MELNKLGCMLAPMLFSIFFSIRFRTDGDVFDMRRLQAKTKIYSITRDLLYADYCALVAHTLGLQEVQELFDRFFHAAQRFGLTVSLKKTEPLHLSYPVNKSANAPAKAGNTQLATVEKFCYLGSFLSNTISVDDDITSRLAKAGCAFGKLQDRLWRAHDVSLRTKIAVYRAVVTTTLLYGCETWTLYRRHQIHKLDQFHMHCLRSIARFKRRDKVPNTDVSLLRICDITGIEAMLLQAQRAGFLRKTRGEPASSGWSSEKVQG